MAITTAERTQIIELTVMMFNAVPGTTYLAQIEEIYEATGNNLNQLAVILAGTNAYRDLNPDTQTAAQFAAALLTPLGLEADATALDFVIARMNAGVSKGQIVYEGYVALNAVPADGAAQYVAANAILNNKLAVAEYYSVGDKAIAETGLSALMTLVAAVTADPATVEAAKALIGQTFTLTTGVDKFTGDTGNNAFNAVVSSLSSEGTLNATDELDGAAGWDTLNIDAKGGFTGFTTGFAKNIEQVEITNSGTIDRTISTKGITGAEMYVLHSASAALNLSDLAAAGITVNVHGQTKGAVSLGFAAAAVAGTADALTLGLNNVGTVEVKTPAVSEQAVAVTAAGIETLNINATGANVVDLAGVSAAKAITVAGDGSLKVNGVAATVTSFDASAATGAVTADLTGAAAAALATVKGGAGDDSFTVDAGDLTATVTLDGGAGANTLTINGGGGTLQPTMSGFQTLGLKGITGDVILSGKNAADLNAVSLAAANALGGNTLTIANLTAPTLAVKTSGAQSASTVNVTSASELTYSTAAAAATVTAKGQDVVAVAVNATEATAAAISIGAYTKQTGAINLSKATSVTVDVASGKTAATPAVEQTEFDATLTAGKATSLTVNAAGKLGTSAAFNVAEATSVTLNATGGGTAAVSAAKATNVSITAGAALALTGSNFGAAETVTVAANKGAITGGINLAKVNSLTLSGADSTSAATFGNLGSASQDYALNVTASGLKAGLTLGTATTNGADITLNLAGVTGNFTVGNVTTGGNTAGAVTLDLSSATGAENIGTLTGKSVTVNAAGYLGGDLTTVGTISANTAVLNGTELGANTFTVTDAKSVTFTGGLLVDTVTITGAAATAATTLAVSLSGGEGDDIFSITAGSGAKTTLSGTVSGGGGADTVAINADAGQVLDMAGLTITSADATIVGSSGADTLKGGDGADTITGAAGADKLTGGAGADTFVFATGHAGVTLATADTIADFVTAVDKIQTGLAGATEAAIADGSALADFTAFVAAADAVLTAGAGANDGIYVAWNAAASGNAWVVVDHNDSGSVDAGDSVIVLTGINTAAEIALADFIA